MEQHATRTAPKCIECKYYWLGVCFHPLSPVSVVTGQPLQTATFFREDGSPCGAEGKLWKKNETKPQPEPEPPPHPKRKWWQFGDK